MTDSPFGKMNPMDIHDDMIKPVIFTGVPLDEFLETHEMVLTREEDGYRYNGFLIEDNDYPLQTAELLDDGIRLMNAKGATLTIEGCQAQYVEKDYRLDELGIENFTAKKQTIIDFQDDMTLTSSGFMGQNRLLSSDPLVIDDSAIFDSAVRGSTIKKSMVQDSTIKFNSTVENSTLNHAEFSEHSTVANVEGFNCSGFKATMTDGNYRNTHIEYGSLENIAHAEDIHLEMAGFKDAENLSNVHAYYVGCDVMDLKGGSLEKKNFVGESQDPLIKADWMEVDWDSPYLFASIVEATGAYDYIIDEYEPTFNEAFEETKEEGKLTLYKEVEDTGDVVIRRDGVNHYHGFAIENDFWKISRLDKDGLEAEVSGGELKIIDSQVDGNTRLSCRGGAVIVNSTFVGDNELVSTDDRNPLTGTVNPLVVKDSFVAESTIEGSSVEKSKLLDTKVTAGATVVVSDLERSRVYQSLVKDSTVKDSTITGSTVEHVPELTASRVDASMLKDMGRVNTSHLTFSEASNGQAFDRVGLYDTTVKDETLADTYRVTTRGETFEVTSEAFDKVLRDPTYVDDFVKEDEVTIDESQFDMVPQKGLQR
jgi:hypothetical protein